MHCSRGILPSMPANLGLAMIFVLTVSKQTIHETTFASGWQKFKDRHLFRMVSEGSEPTRILWQCSRRYLATGSSRRCMQYERHCFSATDLVSRQQVASNFPQKMTDSNPFLGTDGQMDHFCWQKAGEQDPQTTCSSKDHFRESSFELVASFSIHQAIAHFPKLLFTAKYNKKKAPRTKTLHGTLVTHWNGHLLPTPQHCFGNCFLKIAEQTCVRAMRDHIRTFSRSCSKRTQTPCKIGSKQ